MKKQLILMAKIREKTGSSNAREGRKEKQIPAVVYGHNEKTIAVWLDESRFIERLHHRKRLVDVQIDKKPQTMIIKELQYDHLGKDIIHVDLMRVDAAETVRIEVPVELKGTAKGTKEGGIVESHIDKLQIECRVENIPEVIVVSVKDLEIGDALHASDIVLAEGLKLVSAPSTLVATCSLVAAAKTTEELEAEVPAAPEVISEAKETEQEESEEGAQ